MAFVAAAVGTDRSTIGNICQKQGKRSKCPVCKPEIAVGRARRFACRVKYTSRPSRASRSKGKGEGGGRCHAIVSRERLAAFRMHQFVDE